MLKICQDNVYTILHMSIRNAHLFNSKAGSTENFPFPERLHNVAQVYRRCENLPLLSLFHFCFISGIGQAVPPYPSRHRCQTFFLLCTTQGVHKATEPILQHLQWRPQRIRPLERCIVALPARTCQGVNFLMPPGCISSFLPAAGKSLRCRHKSSSKPHSAHMDVERDRQQFAGYAFILPTAWCESFSILLHWQLAHTKVHIVTLLQCLSEFLQKESGVQQISSGTR